MSLTGWLTYNIRDMPIAKICGLRTVEAAETAIDNGADMLGVIAVPKSKRCIETHVAKAISELVRQRRERERRETTLLGLQVPLLTGVFMNQPLEEIIRLQEELGLDVVQLHGDEPIEWCEEIPVPVVKRFTPGTAEFEALVNGKLPSQPDLVLVDTAAGGTGKKVDWTSLGALADANVPYLLAGGLDPENVVTALNQPGILGVDVSSGVETNDMKDPEKIKKFLHTTNRGI